MTPLFWLRLGRWFVQGLVTVLIVAVVVVGTTGIRVWYAARQDHRPASDTIVVLGASQFDGRPSAVFRARLEHAAALFQAGVAPRVVTVGGSQPGDRFTEAAAGRNFLIDIGVPASRIVAVPIGGNTLSSLRAVSDVLDGHGWATAIVVTDPWHSLRAGRIARDEGIDAETSPTRSGPVVQDRGTELRYIARETMAFLYYRMFRRSFDAGPHAV
jgi:uncharacterized SAM-binding protein YcdF (DUF218 family)